VGLLYEVIVTHEKLILYVGGPWPATINDKISVKYSEFLENMKSKLIGRGIKYKLRTGPGQNDFVELSCLFLIADGGYLEWPEIMCGYGQSSDPLKYRFTDWIASIRKDVECLFGILKIRFFYLKRPSYVKTAGLMRAIFVTCCILNNMILRHDGLNNLWESEANWECYNWEGMGADEVTEDENPEPVDPCMPERYNPDEIQLTRLEELPQINYHPASDQIETNFHTLRDYLAKHLFYTYAAGFLRWPKVRKNCIEKNVDLNELVRIYFPGAGDLDFVEDEN